MKIVARYSKPKLVYNFFKAASFCLIVTIVAIWALMSVNGNYHSNARVSIGAFIAIIASLMLFIYSLGGFVRALRSINNGIYIDKDLNVYGMDRSRCLFNGGEYISSVPKNGILIIKTKNDRTIKFDTFFLEKNSSEMKEEFDQNFIKVDNISVKQIPRRAGASDPC